MTRPLQAWIGACCASAAFWGVLALADVRVEVGEAKLPGFSEVEQAVDARMGEKLIGTAQEDVRERFVQERAAYEKELGGVVSELGAPRSATDVLGRAEELADTYQKELLVRARAEIVTAQLRKGYADMLEEHTGIIGKMTDVQKQVNDYQEKINQYNKIYVKAKFLMGR